MPEQNPSIAVIILAAGASARMGKPKQLLEYNGTTLLGYAIKQAKAVSPLIVVVTGAMHDEISGAIDQTGIMVAYNPEWQTGMASSIHSGLKALENHLEITGAMIMLCDQPLITPEHLRALYQAFTGHQYQKIVVTAYQGVYGVPAIFPKPVFAELLQLTGDEGARKLLRGNEAGIISIPFNGASLDIDTPEDYRNITGTN